MNIARAPHGAQWASLVDALHALTNTMTVRTHYGTAHPAIARADAHCFETFTHVLEELSPILIAFTEGEFVICERPFPDLRDRLHVLSQAMARHEIECILVHRGMSRAECELLGSTLNLSADVPGRVRDQAQAKLTHVLLRFLETRPDGVTRRNAGVDTTSLVPHVREVLGIVTHAIDTGTDVDVAAVTTVAREIRQRCATHTFMLEMRSVVDGRDDLAAHATNVGLVTGLLALEAQYSEAVTLDLISAALVHDVGHALLPDRIRGVPSPLLAEADLATFADHTLEGATALLLAGCPELWVMTALEHHRGVDGRGYPALGSRAPHELVRVVALASFIDHKRTLLRGGAVDPAAVLALAASLEDRYFGRPLVRSLIRSLGAYPPGTTVELSNRAPALVTQANGGDPWRPQVQLLRGEDAGSRIELRELSSVGARYELSAVRAIAPPLFVEGDIELAPTEEAPRTRTVVTTPVVVTTPARADVDTILRELLAEDETPVREVVPAPKPPPPAPPLDDLQAKLVEFLSDPPPSAPPLSRPPAKVSKPSMGAFSSRPPQGEATTTTKPPPSAGAYSNAPPRITESTTSSRRPPSSAGAYSSRPPVISEREEKEAGGPTQSSRPSSSSRMPVARSMRPPKRVPACVATAADSARHHGLDARIGFLFSLIDGMTSLEEIADASGIAEEEVTRLIDDLVARGLVAMKEC